MGTFFSRGCKMVYRKRNKPVFVCLEMLESRFALAADAGVLARPPLEQTDSVYLDDSLIGPPPIIMHTAEVIGDETNSFVITSVANGTVEKWLPATESWVNVSAVPTTSNPTELLSLLQLRLIQQGDRIKWTPTQSISPAGFEKAFDVVGWDDGNPLVPPSSEAPSEVQNLRFGQSEDANSLTVSWDPPASFVGSLHYTVTIDNGSTSTTFITTSTSKNFQISKPASHTHSGSGRPIRIIVQRDQHQAFQQPPRKTKHLLLVR